MINIKKIRTASQKTCDFIYNLGFDGLFCKILTIIPLRSFLFNFWINDYKYYEKAFYKFNKLLQENSITYKDKNILEIGSGNSAGLGYFFKAEGCKSYVAGDKYRSAKMSKRALNMEKQLIERVKKLYPTQNIDDLIKISTNEVIFTTEKLRFEKLDITQDKIVFNHKYDFIISFAVLEHIYKKDMPKAIENMNILLNREGLMAHIIDFRDHFNTNFPFNFYKYSDNEWNKLVRDTPFYTNRLRLSDYLNHLKNNNFKIIYIKTDMQRNLIKQIKIHSEFKNKYNNNELELISCILIAKKE